MPSVDISQNVGVNVVFKMAQVNSLFESARRGDFDLVKSKVDQDHNLVLIKDDVSRNSQLC